MHAVIKQFDLSDLVLLDYCVHEHAVANCQQQVNYSQEVIIDT